MIKNSILILFLILIVSCKKNEEMPTASFLTGKGVFILNEGKFMGGNGSLSYYSYDSAKIYNDLFYTVNGRPLGDVPNSMEIKGDLGYIVVNNSGKIEVVRKSTLESVATISGLISPRNIAFISPSNAYVTSMYSDSLTVIDLDNNSISGYVNLRRSSESIIVAGNIAFIACWVGGKEVMVINTAENKVIDSITVGIEPESMVIDRNSMLWVLCNGGWARVNFAELDRINTVSMEVDKKLVFPSVLQSPICLRINGTGDLLYYLENGVQRFGITESELPSEAFIQQSNHYFYELGINPANEDIFVTDAIDYNQRGYLMYYKGDGSYVSSQLADIIPGFMCFKMTEN